MRWAGHVACVGDRRDAYRILAGRPDGKRPPERYRRRCEDIIKMYFQKVEWGAWTGLLWLKTGENYGFL
jgi:hypothetical protein